MNSSKLIQQCIQNQQKHQTYSPEDAILLIDEVKNFTFTDVKKKEVLIQSGKAHYSSMLSKEALPTEMQMEVFHASLERYKDKIADGVMYLAKEFEIKRKELGYDEIVIVSLIRAGLPLGANIQRYLRKEGVKSVHYGISIIRDKGIDAVAMKAIMREHPNAFITFVDGWIGKGAITRQLKKSCQQLGLQCYLYTLSDPTNDLTNDAPYSQDWLIPFGILGSVVSGLLSRTVYQETPRLHGAIYYDTLEYKATDVTAYYLDVIEQAIKERKEQFNAWYGSENKPVKVLQGNDEPIGVAPRYTEGNILSLCRFIMEHHNVAKINNIKPSIAEATRAVLRRVPEKVLVANKQDPDVALLLDLCKRNDVVVEEFNTTPYRAITIIKNS